MLNLQLLEQNNKSFIKDYRGIVESFSTINGNRCESTFSVNSIDTSNQDGIHTVIDQGMHAAIKRLLNIVQKRYVAYDASLYGSLMSMVLVSIAVITLFF